jgi:hypothetical protein
MGRVITRTGARRALMTSLFLAATIAAPGSTRLSAGDQSGKLLAAPRQTSPTARSSSSILTPPVGSLLHGVYPAGTTGQEHEITPKSLREYERLAGKSAAWVYFSSNWYASRAFPVATASWIREAGSVPYIRLMLRSDAAQWHAEPLYTLDRIAKGDFDSDLHAWMGAARDFATPILVEYGTEVNGRWFPWNGAWNGGGRTEGLVDVDEPDGPERFREAYRHIIAIAREERATNIVWVFHVSSQDLPDSDWNRFERYYPGDDWIDWLAVSVYGAQTPMENGWPSFRRLMDSDYRRLVILAPTKPIILAEFGATQGNPHGDQAAWADKALADIVGRRWPRLIGFAWWNEAFPNDSDPAHDTTMRLQDNPALAAVFQRWVAEQPSVLGTLAPAGR